MIYADIPAILIDRRFKSPAAKVWRLWATASGLQAWWGPVGFVSRVDRLDVRVGGGFEIAMRAIGPEQVAYLEAHGIAVDSAAKGVYTAIEVERHLAWRSVVDFVPGLERYEVPTSMSLTATDDGGTALSLHSEPLHDAMWTRNAHRGWAQQLDRLAAELG